MAGAGRRLMVAVLAVLLLGLPAGAAAAAGNTENAPGDPSALAALPSNGAGGVTPDVPTGRFDEPLPGQSTVPDVYDPSRTTPVEELTDQRSARSEVWSNSDGTQTLRSFAEDRYFPSGKDWLAIDNTLVADDSRPGWVHNKANSLSVAFGPIPGDGTGGVELAAGNAHLSYAPKLDQATAKGAVAPSGPATGTTNGTAPTSSTTAPPSSSTTTTASPTTTTTEPAPPTRVGIQPVIGDKDHANEVTYPDVWPGVDLRYTVHGTTAAEELIVKSKPDRASFTFATSGSTALKGAFDDKGTAVGLVTADSAFRIELPQVLNKNGDPIVAAKSVYALASPDKPASDLSVSVDSAWLNSLKSSDYPIIIDPPVSFGPISQGKWRYNDGNYPSSSDLAAGNAGAPNPNFWRSVANFNYNSILSSNKPYNRVISAGVKLHWIGGGGSSQSIDVTWASAWSWAGVATTPALGTGSLSSAADTTIDIKSSMQYFVDNNISAAIGFIGTTENAAVYSYQNFTATLEVTYNQAPPPPSAVAPADGSIISTLTPTLSVNPVTDPEGATVVYYFQVSYRS
jgi:hypothetical protein